MTVPTKNDLTSMVRTFATELENVANLYSGTEAARASVMQIRALAKVARDCAGSIDATDRPYVHPDTAQTLMRLADDAEKIANGSTDEGYATSVRIPVSMLRAFVLRHTPIQTTEGFRFG